MQPLTRPTRFRDDRAFRNPLNTNLKQDAINQRLPNGDFPDIAAANRLVNVDRITKGSFALQLTNNTNGYLIFEVFNPATSCTKVFVPQLETGATGYIPKYTLEGYTHPLGDCVLFNDRGDLLIQGHPGNGIAGEIVFINENTLTEKLVYSYWGVMEYCSKKNFKIINVKVSSLTAAQLDNSLTFFSKYPQGDNSNETIKPSRYISPEQTLQNIAQIKNLNKEIDSFSGIYIKLEVGEMVTLDFDIEFLQSVKGIF